MRGWSRVMRLAFALPNDITRELPPCIDCMKKNISPTRMMIGSSWTMNETHGFGFCGVHVELDGAVLDIGRHDRLE